MHFQSLKINQDMLLTWGSDKRDLRHFYDYKKSYHN